MMRASRRLKLLEEAAEEERGAREAVAGVPESEVSREMIRIRHAIWSDPLKWDENGNQRGGARVGLETLTWEAARRHVHNRIHGKGLDLIGGVITGAGGRKWCVVAVVAGSTAGGAATVWAIDTAVRGGECKVLRISGEGLSALSNRMREARAAAVRGENTETTSKAAEGTTKRKEDVSGEPEGAGGGVEELTTQPEATMWLEGAKEDEPSMTGEGENENEIMGIEDMDTEEIITQGDVSRSGRTNKKQSNTTMGKIISKRTMLYRSIAQQEKDKERGKADGKSRERKPRNAEKRA